MKEKTNNKTAVVVTTSHHGVFFGYIEEAKLQDTLTLTNARMCVYWPVSVHGVLGLAATGPLDGSKVTPLVLKIQVNNCDCLMVATEEAVANWEKGLWS